MEERAPPDTGETGVKGDSEVMPEGESTPGGGVMEEMTEREPARGAVVGGRGPTVVVVPVVVIVSSMVGDEGWGKRGVALLCVGKVLFVVTWVKVVVFESFVKSSLVGSDLTELVCVCCCGLVTCVFQS